jgi:hypothetical protein
LQERSPANRGSTTLAAAKLNPLAHQLVSAVAYLHSRRIVHGNLACSHVYMLDDNTIKLSGLVSGKRLDSKDPVLPLWKVNSLELVKDSMPVFRHSVFHMIRC